MYVCLPTLEQSNDEQRSNVRSEENVRRLDLNKIEALGRQSAVRYSLRRRCFSTRPRLDTRVGWEARGRRRFSSSASSSSSEKSSANEVFFDIVVRRRKRVRFALLVAACESLEFDPEEERARVVARLRLLLWLGNGGDGRLVVLRSLRTRLPVRLVRRGWLDASFNW